MHGLSRSIESDVRSRDYGPRYEPLKATLLEAYKALEGQRLKMVSQLQEISTLETSILR